MIRTLIATAIALALSGRARGKQVATAYTGSSAYPGPVARPVYAQQVLRDTGSENGPTFGPGQTQVIAGHSGLLPENGSDGIVQSANSMPASTIYGTTAFANAAPDSTRMSPIRPTTSEPAPFCGARTTARRQHTLIRSGMGQRRPGTD